MVRCATLPRRTSTAAFFQCVTRFLLPSAVVEASVSTTGTQTCVRGAPAGLKGVELLCQAAPGRQARAGGSVGGRSSHASHGPLAWEPSWYAFDNPRHNWGTVILAAADQGQPVGAMSWEGCCARAGSLGLSAGRPSLALQPGNLDLRNGRSPQLISQPFPPQILRGLTRLRQSHSVQGQVTLSHTASVSLREALMCQASHAAGAIRRWVLPPPGGCSSGRCPCWLAWPEAGLASRSILNSSIPRAHQPKPAQQEAQHLPRTTPPAWQAVQAGTASSVVT